MKRKKINENPLENMDSTNISQFIGNYMDISAKQAEDSLISVEEFDKLLLSKEERQASNPSVELAGIMIRNLFGVNNYDINLHNPITILIGPNGTGKSTILNLISYLYTWNLEGFARVEFDSCEFRFIKPLNGIKSPILTTEQITNVNLPMHSHSSVLITRTELKRSSSDTSKAFRIEARLISSKGHVKRKNSTEFIITNGESSREVGFLGEWDGPDWLLEHLGSRKAVLLSSDRLADLMPEVFEPLGIQFRPETAVSYFSNYLQILLGGPSDQHIMGKLYTGWSIAERLNFMCEALNKRITNKEFVIIPNQGFVIKNRSGNPIDPEHLSSGEQHLFVIFFVLLFSGAFWSEDRFNEAPIILIDEPEISLHVAWQSDFIEDIMNITPVVQGKYIIATHSPSIVHNHWDITVELSVDQ